MLKLEARAEKLTLKPLQSLPGGVSPVTVTAVACSENETATASTDSIVRVFARRAASYVGQIRPGRQSCGFVSKVPGVWEC